MKYLLLLFTLFLCLSPTLQASFYYETIKVNEINQDIKHSLKGFNHNVYEVFNEINNENKLLIDDILTELNTPHSPLLDLIKWGNLKKYNWYVTNRDYININNNQTILDIYLPSNCNFVIYGEKIPLIQGYYTKFILYSTQEVIVNNHNIHNVIKTTFEYLHNEWIISAAIMGTATNIPIEIRDMNGNGTGVKHLNIDYKNFSPVEQPLPYKIKIDLPSKMKVNEILYLNYEVLSSDSYDLIFIDCFNDSIIEFNKDEDSEHAYRYNDNFYIKALKKGKCIIKIRPYTSYNSDYIYSKEITVYE